MQRKWNLKCIFKCDLSCSFLSIFILIFKCTFRYSSRSTTRCAIYCIIKRTSSRFIVVSFALSYASTGALKSSLQHSSFICPNLHSTCNFNSILKVFSNVFRIRFHFQFQFHLLGKLYMTKLCSPKKIIDCTLKCTMIYANVCIDKE